MPNDHVQFCHYTSGDPCGQFLDLLRFVKNELRGISEAALQQQHGATHKLAEDAIEALDHLWKKAARCNDPAEPYPAEQREKTLSDIAESLTFQLQIKRHWGWLFENWRTVLPRT